MDVRAHDGLFWRRLAHAGAAHGPEWWVRYSPAFFGLAAAALVPDARRAVQANLRMLCGPQPAWREALGVARTFTTYAGCLAEILSAGSKNGRLPEALVWGKPFLDAVIAKRAGVVVATVHTAGWEIVGPLLTRDQKVELMMVMEPERSAAARDLHDRARFASGVKVVHTGEALASLPMLRHLRAGGALALQIDRVAPGMRTRAVQVFGRDGVVPEGPLRLAQLSGSPVLPVFCARKGYRRYVIEILEPFDVPRRATETELDARAQRLADAMTIFLRDHPTQWLRFAPA
jgi:KDO2-lipid IV(A) lauroyltransferase